MNPSVEQLLSIARCYWPAELHDYLQPGGTPERKRFQELWRRELTKMDRWRTFLEKLGGELPGFTIGNVTVPFDACFRCAAYPRNDDPTLRFEWVVVGCVSILAPVYAVYGVQYEREGKDRINSKIFLDSPPLEMADAWRVVSRAIEATFGLSALPRELADMRVPLFVDPQQPPNTTLFHALFTSQPESVP